MQLVHTHRQIDVVALRALNANDAIFVWAPFAPCLQLSFSLALYVISIAVAYNALFVLYAQYSRPAYTFAIQMGAKFCFPSHCSYDYCYEISIAQNEAPAIHISDPFAYVSAVNHSCMC